MTNLIIAVSHISAGLLQTALYLLLISRLLPSRRPEKKGVLVALAGTAAFLILLSLAGLPDFYNAGLKALLLTFCAGRLLKANIRMSLFISIFYEIALSFWQFLLLHGWAFCSAARFYPMTKPEQDRRLYGCCTDCWLPLSFFF